MSRIAQKRHVPDGPSWHWVAVEQTPFEDLIRAREKFLEIFMPAAERREKLFASGWNVPGFGNPVLALHNSDNVHRFAGGDIVGNHMPLGAKPEGAVRTDEVEGRGVERNDRTPAHIAGETGRLIAEKRFPDGGV